MPWEVTAVGCSSGLIVARTRRTIRFRPRPSGAENCAQIHSDPLFADHSPAVRRKFVRRRFARGHGSGLGLAIVSRIVADHHGSFTLESELRAGTVATVGLPVAADEA